MGGLPLGLGLSMSGILPTQIIIDKPYLCVYCVYTLKEAVMKRHYRVEAAREEARKLIEKTVHGVMAEMTEKLKKRDRAGYGELRKELVLLGEKA